MNSIPMHSFPHLVVQFGMQDLHTQLLRAGISSYNVHTNYLGILLECSFCFSKSGVEPNILHFNKVPGDGMMMDLVSDSLVVPC